MSLICRNRYRQTNRKSSLFRYQVLKITIAQSRNEFLSPRDWRSFESAVYASAREYSINRQYERNTARKDELQSQLETQKAKKGQSLKLLFWSEAKSAKQSFASNFYNRFSSDEKLRFAFLASLRSAKFMQTIKRSIYLQKIYLLLTRPWNRKKITNKTMVPPSSAIYYTIV